MAVVRRRSLAWAELAGFLIANAGAYFDFATQLGILPLEPVFQQRAFAYSLVASIVLLILAWIGAGDELSPQAIRSLLWRFLALFVLGIIGFWIAGWAWRRLPQEVGMVVATQGEAVFYGLTHAGFAGIIALGISLVRSVRES